MCTNTVFVSVKRKLIRHVEFWKQQLQAPLHILRVIQEGYVIQFLEQPVAYSCPNQSSVLSNASFVHKVLDELLGDGRIKEVESQPRVYSPLS